MIQSLGLNNNMKEYLTKTSENFTYKSPLSSRRSLHRLDPQLCFHGNWVISVLNVPCGPNGSYRHQ